MWGLPPDGKQSVQVRVVPNSQDRGALYMDGRGTVFTKLDLKHSYQQLVLDEESKKYTTIDTHRGLFRYNRLPFGVSSAPAIFQRTMDSLLQWLQHVTTYLDDILITGKDNQEHLQNLEKV